MNSLEAFWRVLFWSFFAFTSKPIALKRCSLTAPTPVERCQSLYDFLDELQGIYGLDDPYSELNDHQRLNLEGPTDSHVLAALDNLITQYLPLYDLINRFDCSIAQMRGNLPEPDTQHTQKMTGWKSTKKVRKVIDLMKQGLT